MTFVNITLIWGGGIVKLRFKCLHNFTSASATLNQEIMLKSKPYKLTRNARVRRTKGRKPDARVKLRRYHFAKVKWFSALCFSFLNKRKQNSFASL